MQRRPTFTVTRIDVWTALNKELHNREVVVNACLEHTSTTQIIIFIISIII